MTPQKHVAEAPAIQSWDGADRVLGEIRELEAQITSAEGAKALGMKIAQDRWDAKIAPLIESRSLRAKSLKEFAEFHREDLGTVRSKDLNHGRVGFRLGQPQLKPLAKWTWEKVLTLLRSKDKSEFIRTEETVRKDVLLSSDLDTDGLKSLGVQRVQEDRFFYEVKSDETVAAEKA